MRTGYYRLNSDGTTTEVTNISDAGWEPTDRRVAETTLDDGRWVSTVFLTIDHGFGGRPLLFETMVFPSKDDLSDQFCQRYSTIEEARAGHERIVEALRAGRDPGDEDGAR